MHVRGEVGIIVHVPELIPICAGSYLFDMDNFCGYSMDMSQNVIRVANKGWPSWYDQCHRLYDNFINE